MTTTTTTLLHSILESLYLLSVGVSPLNSIGYKVEMTLIFLPTRTGSRGQHWHWEQNLRRQRNQHKSYFSTIFLKIKINAKYPSCTNYQNLNPLGGCGSFPKLNEISTGQFHIFFLLLFSNKKSYGHLTNPKESYFTNQNVQSS